MLDLTHGYANARNRWGQCSWTFLKFSDFQNQEEKQNKWWYAFATISIMRDYAKNCI